MDGYQYEKKCAELLKAKGFSKVQVTPGSGDQGIDVIAYRARKKYGVQCKYYEGTVGNKAIQEVYAGAAYYNCDIALVISNSTFTKPAKELADKLSVELWENVDAIYLQKHTEEYIKKEKALKQKKKEQEQKQRLLSEQEKQRKKRLEIKEKAEAEKRAKELEKSGELDQKRQYIQYATGRLGVSNQGYAYVKPDGTVASLTNFSNIGGKGDPGNTIHFSNIKSIVCTEDGIVGLRHDGSCIATKPGFGYAYIGECNSWSHIVDIAAGEHQVVGLKSTGTCVANSIKWNTGYGYDGQSDVFEWRDIVQIACGGNFSLGLQSDGHVVFAGKSYQFGPYEIESWANIKMIAACGDIAVGLTNEGKVISAGRASIVGINPGKGILQFGISGQNVYALYADGTIGGGGSEHHEKIEAANIVSLISSRYILYALDKAGVIHRYGKVPNFYCAVPENIRIFENYDQLLQEKAQQEERRSKELCQHCGGSFKGFVVERCSVCHRRKDY